MSVVVYSGPSCVRCKMTIDKLVGAGIDVEVIDVSEDDQLRDKAIALVDGQRELPIVDAGEGDRWSGFRPERTKAVIERLGEA